MTQKIRFLGLTATLAALFLTGPLLRAQSESGSNTRRLIVQSIDEDRRVILAGNTRPEANSANDRGLVSDGLPMEHIQMQLQLPAEKEQELEQLISELHDPASPSYHRWLTPDEFKQRFGLSQTDIDSVSAWLKSSGFTVNVIYPRSIDFSGTAAEVRNAFKTEIHSLEVNGVKHIANMTDPQIPAALAPAVVGMMSLNDFMPRPLYHPRSNYTVGGLTLLVPADVATIYDFNPVFGRGVSGQGQTIVVLEDSDVYTTADWNSFRSALGLMTTFPAGSFTQVHPQPSSGLNNCFDPGVNGDETEAILDAEWASAGAPSAAILLVSCSDTQTFGGFIGLQNLLNSSGTPPAIVSISYGGAEPFLGQAGNVSISALYQQAVAEGVSVFVATGDEGAASSDPNANLAIHGIAVSGLASTPYNVAVGGTDFGDTFAGTTGTYWNSTNGTNFVSAKSYVPEIPWNNSCASTLAATFLFGPSEVTYGTNGFCNSPTGQNYFDDVAGSGGPSGCATGASAYSGVASGTCAGYAKPSWQSVLGNPTDSVRDIPDVSLFASNGFWGHYYVVCWSDIANGGSPCTGDPSTWSGFGGTSVASPLMAGVQALVNQTISSRSGNPNPSYYSLAATEYGLNGNTSCNSSLGNSVATTCVFHDITQGDMDIPCTGVLNCYLPSGVWGVLSKSNSSYQPAYATNIGWDFATGIGTVDVNNLVKNWPQLASLSQTSLSFGLQTIGTASAAQTVTLTNSSTQTLTIASIAITGTNSSDFVQTQTCGTSLAAGTQCTISVIFRPSASGIRTASITITDNATGSLQTVTLSGTGTAIALSPASLVFAAQFVGTTSAAQTVTLANMGTTVLAITSIAVSGANSADFSETQNCGGSVAAGANCTIGVTFTPTASGTRTASITFTDSATGSPQTVILTGTGSNIPTTTAALVSSLNPSVVGQSVTFTATVTGTGSGATPTGTVTFFDNGTSIGTGMLNTSAVASLVTTSLAAGPHPITAQYSGDENFVGSTSPIVTQEVVNPVPAIASLSPSSATAGGLASTLTVNGTHFVSGATVNFNGSARITTFVSATQLTASITAADIASAGWDQITVTNPIGGLSNSVAFTVNGGGTSPTTPPALYFVPVTPCRLVDTRNTPNGPFAGPSISGGTSRNFTIPQSTTCSIPSTAAAYSLNVAVIPTVPLGFLTLWPTGQAQPVAATVSSVDGRVRSNAAIVPAGTGGAISAFASNTADLVIDIDGYFTTAPTALQFYPVTPCRLVDTRNANGPLGGPSLAANTSRTFPLPSSSCNLPGNAQAYSLNLAAVPQGPLGYLTAWPAGQTQPGTANLSSTTGTVTANAAIVPAGTNGSIDVFASNSTDLVIDVNGYFAPAGTGGLSLYPLPPCRVLDTRQLSDAQTSQPFSGELDENIQASACGVTVGAQAYVLNATVVPSVPLGYLTLWPQGTSQPLAATLSDVDATVTSNLAIVPTTNGSISAFAANPTQLIMDLFGYFAPSATYTIGGTVSGLSGTGLVLQDDGGNNLPISTNGNFTFPGAIFGGANYNVTVLTQPLSPAQNCLVTNGSGTASANVTNVQVSCTTIPLYTVGGTVSGLLGTGLVLQDNGGNNLAVGTNGNFTFTAAILSGGAYNVTVLTQPSSPAQSCLVANGSGTASANVANVQVACTTITYTIGGTVINLAGASGGLQLQDNGGDTLSVNANGTFTFHTALVSGGTYNVLVSAQPSSPAQTCQVTNGTGTATGNVTSVVVDCGYGEWTWVGGSNGFDQSGIYGTLGRPSASNIPGARLGAVSWTDKAGNFWLFGGAGFDSIVEESGTLNDLWKYSEGQWTWMGGSNLVGPNYGQTGIYGTLGRPSSSNIPGARYYAVGWTDAAGNLWLFGGLGFDSVGEYSALNDLWEYSPTTGQWTWVSGSNLRLQSGVYGTQGTPSPSNVPGARAYAVSWTDKAGNLWLFGGEGIDSVDSSGYGLGQLNDLWEYSPSTGQWTWMSGSNINTPTANAVYGTQGVSAPTNVPSARVQAVGWTDAVGNLWLFGGFGPGLASSGDLNDLWKYSKGEWTWMGGSNMVNQLGVYGTLGTAAPGNTPGARSGALTWTDAAGNFWLFGGAGFTSAGESGVGEGGGATELNDLWKFSTSTGEWTWIGGSNIAVNGSLGAAPVYGSEGTPTPSNNPGARDSIVGWTDVGGNLWLFGGYVPYALGNTPTIFNDLWRYEPSTIYTIGGTVSGLSGTGLVLQDNGGNNLPVNANGSFTFGAALGIGSSYNVTVLTQPSSPAQTCGVADGSGTDASAKITNVQVTCVTTTVTYTIGGTVSGLSGTGLVLQDNGGNNLPVNGNGSFTFTTSIASGATYSVTVLTQPSGPAQYCEVTGGSGTASANVTGIKVACVASTVTYTIGGTVINLASEGGGLQLQDNGTESLLVNTDGSFTFPTALPSGSTYSVTVSVQPSSPAQTCGVTNGTGTATANVTSVVVDCGHKEWAWESGSNLAGAYGIYGTEGSAAASNIPGARQAAITWTDGTGNFWLFGGQGYDSTGVGFGNLNDLWKYSGSEWTWMSGSNVANQSAAYGTLGTPSASNVPGGRFGSVSWTDKSGNLWLFGGQGSPNEDLNDLWEFSAGEWTWMNGSNGFNQNGTYGTLGAAAAGNVPGARQNAVSWTDKSGNFWLFGGLATGKGHFNDLWEYSTATGEWTWMGGLNGFDQIGTYGTLGMAAASNVPGARQGAISWTDAAGNFWLFGGQGFDSTGAYGYLSDLWEYSAGKWTWIGGSNVSNQKGTYGTEGTAASGNAPGARSSAVIWTDAAGNFWLFGGYGYDSAGTLGQLSDLWEYSAGAWSWVDGPKIVNQNGMYGYQDTPAPSNVPGARQQFVGWTDKSGNLWLFGGYGNDSAEGGGYLNDLWKYEF